MVKGDVTLVTIRHLYVLRDIEDLLEVSQRRLRRQEMGKPLFLYSKAKEKLKEEEKSRETYCGL